MPIKKLTLGIALFGVATLASPSYTVRKGDTLSEIADKLHVSAHALQKANGLGKKHTLRIGMKLTVPKGERVAKVSKKSVRPSAGDTYTVRPGENDWIIANRAGLKLKDLHALNPNVKWSSLQVGAKLRLPSGMGVAVKTPRLRSRVAVVKGDDVTVRRQPGTGAERVCSVDAGTRVAVLARDGGWYKLRFPKGTVGWVRGDLLKASALASATAAKSKVRHQSTSYVATMRRKPQTKAQRIAQAKKHQANVRARYVRRWSAKQRKYVVAPLKNGGDLIARAETFRGVRYSWGQASRSGTDCSGFTTQVFRGEGVKLPRTSREQATIGNKVDRNHLSKGDLVFFRTGRGHRITHVGIYMGAGKFIHASSGGGKVQVNNLSDGYYSNRFVTARRVPKKSSK